MRASCLIRAQPHYRRYAFCKGLQACGYSISEHAVADPRPGDVLVIWNRYGDREDTAKRYEREGAQVLVAENGYVGRDAQGRQFYALARNQHNGAGTWPDRQGTHWLAETDTYGARWRGLGILRKPLRTDGEHILVCPSRGIGPRGIAMPHGWENDVVVQLRRHTRRPIRVRPHPGDRKPSVELAADLANCWAAVIWNSAAGVHAMLAGIPVIACAPHWVLKSAAPARLEEVETPPVGELEPAFERLAWAQWSVEELETGVPFRHLLSDARQGEVAAAA